MNSATEVFETRVVTHGQSRVCIEAAFLLAGTLSH